ncbi:inner membrane protein [Escherichia coli]|uniref:Inner membrane protein n=1 Tax=Escherichia coli TaxID=562 RepID=A0A377DQ03_ECOLX|nr:inner membrane protein [Escherichia coli]
MKAEASKVTVAVATVVIFGTVAIFLYPAIYPLMSQWFSPETFGIYIGSTVHEVAQVVAAGHAISPDAENAAVISKMLRVMMLASVSSSCWRRVLNSCLGRTAARKAKSLFRGLPSCSS